MRFRFRHQGGDAGASLILVLLALTFVAFVVSIVLGLTQTGFLAGSQSAAAQANRLNVENALQAANGFAAKGANCPSGGGTFLVYAGVTVTCSGTTGTGVSGTDQSGTGLSGSDAWNEAVTLHDTGVSFMQNDYSMGGDNPYQGGTFLVQGNFQAAGSMQIIGGSDTFGNTACTVTGKTFAQLTQTTPYYGPMVVNGCLQTVLYPGTLTAGDKTTSTTRNHAWSDPAPVWSASLNSLSVPSQVPTGGSSGHFDKLVGEPSSGTITTRTVSSSNCLHDSSGHKYLLLQPGYYTDSWLNKATGGSNGSVSRSCPFGSSTTKYLVVLAPGYYYVSLAHDWLIQGGTRVIGGYGNGDSASASAPTNTVANLACDTPAEQAASGQDTGVLMTVGNYSSNQYRNGIVVTDSAYSNGNGQDQNTFSLCAGNPTVAPSARADAAGDEPVALYGYFNGSSNMLSGSQRLYSARACSAASADPGNAPSSLDTNTTGNSNWCPLLSNPIDTSSGNASNDSQVGLQGAVYAESDALGLVINAPNSVNGEGGENGNLQGNDNGQGNGNGFTGGLLITYGIDLNGLNVLNIGHVMNSEGDGRCVDNNEHGQGENFCGGSVPAWQPAIAEPVSTITGLAFSATSGSVTGVETLSIAGTPAKLNVLTWKET